MAIANEWFIYPYSYNIGKLDWKLERIKEKPV
jgi:hypothetical protein